MKLLSSTTAIHDIQSAACFVFAHSDKKTKSITDIDSHSDNQLSGFIESGVVSTKVADITPLVSIKGIGFSTVYVIGCGDSANFKENDLIKVVAALSATIKRSGLADIYVALDDLQVVSRNIHWVTQKVTERLITGFYQYDTTKSKKNDRLSLEMVTFLSSESGLQLAIDNGLSIGHGINIARELANLPANICTPTYLGEQALALDVAYPEISSSVIDESELEAMGMGCFMSVSRGSVQPGKLIVMNYQGDSSGAKPHVIVGKGITFDTGGISLKPGAGMDEMKYDMGGAASVLGTMHAIAELKPNINVIGVIAAAENMPAGNATKPGDVVTSLSGKTVEVCNTDAEGRLVLADALTYVERFDPETVIDIATLTGAVVVALGHHPTAVYANNESLQQAILAAGTASWDRGWPMPLWDDYREEIDTPYADLANVSNVGRAGGSITAAMFLAQFASKFTWAHLDIAGTAWRNKKEGASGRPVGMLTQYLLDKSA